jgi:hypothetical protein
VVSKPQIRFKGKASGYGGTSRESAVRHKFWRMSICRRPATQPLSLRWGFETTSSLAAINAGNKAGESIYDKNPDGMERDILFAGYTGSRRFDKSG